ncbi:pyruvate carboxylase domain protein [Mycobacterium xenopi 4042]|uniref:Pyruvate carboxylase domain protein n=1 Tax=Mycobacterium xenopi 4042 TaxID=1299334 RepID=X8CH72_MYCXE|nr:pyruvate carboxylase domain protein [Mycobacterium xenopi 4042]
MIHPGYGFLSEDPGSRGPAPPRDTGLSAQLPTCSSYSVTSPRPAARRSPQGYRCWMRPTDPAVSRTFTHFSPHTTARS